MSGIYHGRLVCDGDGNLLADEGENKGYPVRYHEGSYVFVEPGEPSHNQTHEQQKVVMTGTVDSSMTNDESLVNAYEDGDNAHHFDKVDPDNRPPVDPDAISAKISGHTDAYKGGE